MSTYVLVHGAFHGAWCWEKVTPLLEAAGHKAVAVDLPGHGDNPAPIEAQTLAGYVDHVGAIVEAQDGPVILVGHSLGGITVTAVAERLPDRVAWAVYCTAMLPRDGQTRAELGKLEGERSSAVNRVFSEDGRTSTMKEETIRETFYGECSDADYNFARVRLVPQATQPATQPIHSSPERFGRVRRAYIECLRDKAIPISMQRAMAEGQPCERTFSIDADHSPFFSRPMELAQALLELAE